MIHMLEIVNFSELFIIGVGLMGVSISYFLSSFLHNKYIGSNFSAKTLIPALLFSFITACLIYLCVYFATFIEEIYKECDQLCGLNLMMGTILLVVPANNSDFYIWSVRF